MTRSVSHDADPHRPLFISDDPLRGEDVRALASAAAKRLDARNVNRKWSAARSGVLAAHGDFDNFVLTARLLGALESTLGVRDGHGRPILTVGAQEMIRHPGRRTPAQLARADSRMGALEKAREHAAASRKDRGGGVSGLTATQRGAARDRAVAAFRLLYNHRGAVHYTQAAARWNAINARLRSANGEWGHYYDCSSAYTWCLWNALTSVAGTDFRDIVNGSGWRAGYTGTLLVHGEPVDSRMPGDAVIYGRGFPGSHVAMVAEDTRYVYSHGSEAGPFYVPWNYRGDVMGVRRFI